MVELIHLVSSVHWTIHQFNSIKPIFSLNFSLYKNEFSSTHDQDVLVTKVIVSYRPEYKAYILHESCSLIIILNTFS